ncbi:MAG: hypothetical protein E6G64_09890 [Actinobacteria bacterium]|nr:MAG: hypothetical protein E6G64_09890 [Actinomycetota bacterium]
MTTVGGQAVLEGVMMRGPSNWAVAVRKPDGDIAQVHQPIRSPMARHWAFRIPVVRGVVALGESLAIGFRFMYGRMKLACEVAGAATAAALLAGKIDVEPGQKVAAVVSGGNVAPKTAAAILASDEA